MRFSMRTLVASSAAVVVGAGLLMAAPTAQAAPAAPTTTAVAPLSAPVTGSFTDDSGAAGVFAGTFAPTGFEAVGDEVVATGNLTGTLTDATGTEVGTVDQAISTPIDRSASADAVTAAASCQILDLRLQPLDLNLLGLKVHLDTVHLNITAQTGPGNLLGNLLCAVTGLLDGAGALSQIAALLNQILAILNGLGV